MAEKNMWMVRCGRNSAYFDDFKDKQVVAIGFMENHDLTNYKTPNEVWELIKSSHKEWAIGKARNVCGQVFTFSLYFNIDDAVITYDCNSRNYLIGQIVSDYSFDKSANSDMQHFRKVKWTNTLSRDQFSVEAKNSLGAIQTVFKIPEKVISEINSLISGKAIIKDEIGTEIAPIATESEDLEDLYNDIQERSKEFIKDKVLKLDWDQMQRLVAGILRGMGYRTRISPKGSDRGRDIVASPDGLGLENPRIVVEVKHRQNSMGSQELRSFLGGLRSGDKGLYVSTGGFSKDAKYEADRSNVPITLIDLDDLVELLMQHYENIDPDTRSLTPLVKLYWPVN